MTHQEHGGEKTVPPRDVVLSLVPAGQEATREGEVNHLTATQGSNQTGSDILPASTPRRELTDFLAPPHAPDELGRLGGYRVLQVLGSGGMGVVFRAEDPLLGRPVALKAILPGLAASGTARERFLREAKAAATVKHDHVVSIYQVGEERGVPFLAMEYLEGESLEDRLQRQPRLPQTQAVRIGREIALGLAAAHKRGLIHRDVKPANVWLEGESARVKLLDFGLARTAGVDSQLTQQGAIIGTPAFMAPEQATGQTVDCRCDLFSLGCVLYKLCTGELAFKGADPIATLMAVATEQPIPPRQLNPELTPELSDLILRLLAKKPEQRPASAEEVVQALYVLDQAPTRAPTPRPRRSRWLLVSTCVLVAGVLVAGLVFRPGWFGIGWRNRDEGEFRKPITDPSNLGVPGVPLEWDDDPPRKGTLRNDFKFDVELLDSKAGKDGTRELIDGQRIRFEIKVEKDAYVGIWSIEDGGSIVQVFPNKFDGPNFVKAGETRIVGEKSPIRATVSRKPEMVRAVASTTPWQDFTVKRAEPYVTWRSAEEKEQFQDNLRGMVVETRRAVSEVRFYYLVKPKP